MFKRRFPRFVFPLVSAVGLGICSAAFVWSFSERGAESSSLWSFALCVLGLVVYSAMLTREGRSSRSLVFQLEGFATGAPFVTVPIGWVLNVCALASLVYMAKSFGAGVPIVIDGQYVIDSHGRVLRELTRTQYLAAEGLLARCTVVFYLPAYWVAFTYWCLGRGSPKRTGLEADGTNHAQSAHEKQSGCARL